MTETRVIPGLELRDDRDGRTLVGIVVPYDTETRIGNYLERFAPGAFDGTDPGTVPLLTSHEHAALPIGRTLTLSEETRGLIAEFHLAETPKGDEVLALARAGVPLGLSVGFRPQVDQWNGDRSKVTRVRAALHEVSVVGVPAYADARVEAVRAAADLEQTHHLNLALARRR